MPFIDWVRPAEKWLQARGRRTIAVALLTIIAISVYMLWHLYHHPKGPMHAAAWAIYALAP